MEATGTGPSRLRVMHVTEALGAGVQSAVNYWLAETPDLDHVFVGAVRDGTQTGDLPHIPFCPGHLRRMRQLGQLVRRHRPDVIHAHSSLAGVYVRLNPLLRGVPIVYSPHCFAFERTDLGPGLRKVLRLAESLMSVRTAAFVTVSEHESKLTEHFLRRRPSWVAPVFRSRAVSSSEPGCRSRRVVAIGRVAAQKDPGFMAGAVRQARAACPGTEFMWVGDGDPALSRGLAAAGMTVLGWKSHAETLELLRGADVLVHSAAWEGAPVVVEEALAAGKPVVARRLPTLEDRGLTGLARTPEEMATQLVALLTSEQARERAAAESCRLAHERCDECGDALETAYRKARRGT